MQFDQKIISLGAPTTTFFITAVDFFIAFGFFEITSIVTSLALAAGCWVFKGTNIDSDTSLPDWIVTSTQLCMAVAQSTETPFIKNIFIADILSQSPY